MSLKCTLPWLGPLLIVFTFVLSLWSPGLKAVQKKSDLFKYKNYNDQKFAIDCKTSAAALEKRASTSSIALIPFP